MVDDCWYSTSRGGKKPITPAESLSVTSCTGMTKGHRNDATPSSRWLWMNDGGGARSLFYREPERRSRMSVPWCMPGTQLSGYRGWRWYLSGGGGGDRDGTIGHRFNFDFRVRRLEWMWVNGKETRDAARVCTRVWHLKRSAATLWHCDPIFTRARFFLSRTIFQRYRATTNEFAWPRVDTPSWVADLGMHREIRPPEEKPIELAWIIYSKSN